MAFILSQKMVDGGSLEVEEGDFEASTESRMIPVQMENYEMLTAEFVGDSWSSDYYKVWCHVECTIKNQLNSTTLGDGFYIGETRTESNHYSSISSQDVQAKRIGNWNAQFAPVQGTWHYMAIKHKE